VARIGDGSRSTGAGSTRCNSASRASAAGSCGSPAASGKYSSSVAEPTSSQVLATRRTSPAVTRLRRRTDSSASWYPPSAS
jgi:hypothetical protein